MLPTGDPELTLARSPPAQGAWPTAGRARGSRDRARRTAMRTVSCLIRSKAKPAIWAEFEVGLDDQDQKAWWLRRSSKVAFNQFPAKQGAWDYVTIHQISGD